ncbi:MAG: polyketide synthase [Cirrosporium novae-zelandiae]|nr:MAG: polyketide synthase [Cirrosporium novae-zelandiae]
MRYEKAESGATAYSGPSPSNHVDCELPQAPMPIAIIGMACRFPGDVTSPERLWRICAERRSTWSKIPSDRFNQEAFYHPCGEKRGTLNLRGGHFLKDGITRFDAPFFNLTAEEARSMDPQLRLQLETSYEALENAGMTVDALSGTDTSVFSGSFTRDYHDSMMRDSETLPRYFVTGNGMAMLSNRISYFFNLKGSSLTVDTGCSTSLVALHLACQSLRAGESGMSIVGGSNVIINPDMPIGMTNLGFLSPDGKSFAFDHRACGYGRGEGVATLVIKPLKDALRDGDPIRAVIRETLLNQDGKTAGITLPSSEAHQALIRAAYKNVGLDPLETAYFEAHGTGTKVGDPREAEAIGTVFGEKRSIDNPICIGSVKANVGHLEAASGLAGIIKSTMAIEKALIPPLAEFEKINPKISLEKWKLKIPLQLEPWPSNDIRRVSVSSLGYGGTNAHVILENADRFISQLSPINGSVKINASGEHQRQIFMLSAKDEGAARDMVANLNTYIKEHTAPGVNEGKWLNNLAYTLSERRSRFPWVAATSATSLEDLTEALQDTKFRPERSTDTPRLGFVFTGQGAQYYRMGRELSVYPVYRDTLRAADEYLRKLGCPWSLWDELHQDEKSSRVNIASISQPLCSAVQIALVRLLDSWGIKPTAVTGHSSGEIASGYAAGVLSLQDAMTIAYFRGELALKAKEKAPDLRGGMIAVGLGQDETEKRIAQVTLGKIIVACVNSPSSVTVSGDTPAIEELQTILEAEKVFARRLNVDAAYHSHHMRLISDEYYDHLRDIQAPKELGNTIFSSSVTGKRIESVSEIGPDYWVRNMVQPVLFSSSLHNMCLSRASKDPTKNGHSVDVLVEIGPHSALAGPIRQTLTLPELKDLPISYTSCLVRKVDAVKTMQDMACVLLSKGYRVNMNAVNFPTGAPPDLQVVTDLPTYPWSHKIEHWQESRLNREHRLRTESPHDLLGVPQVGMNPSLPTWRHFIRPSDIPWVRDHVVQSTIIYPAAGYISMVIEGACQISTDRENILGFKLFNIDVKTALVVPDNSEGVEVQMAFQGSCDKLLGAKEMQDFQIYSVGQDSEWTIHCTGSILVQRKRTLDGPSWKQTHKTGLPSIAYSLENRDYTKSLSPSRLYKGLHAVGICHGPAFQNLDEIRVGKQRSLAVVSIPDTASMLPYKHEHSHIVHPTTLDAVFQAVYSAFSEKGMENSTTMVPHSFKSLFVSYDISNQPGHKLRVCSMVNHADAQGFESSIEVVNETDLESRPVVKIEGFRCTSIGNSASQEDIGERKLCFQMLWDNDLLSLSPDGFKSLLGVSGEPAEIAMQADLQRASLYIIEEALGKISNDEFQAMKPHHQKLYSWMKMQYDLGKQQKLQYQTSEWLQSNEDERNNLLKKAEPSCVNGEMLCRIGRNLVEILRGEVEPLQVMLEGRLLYSYYEKALALDRTYKQTAKLVDLYAHKYPNATILEIGAGTGGCTLPVLEALGGDSGSRARFHRYDFTDISSGFFEKAREKFSAWGDRMNFKKFNVENDPTQQGLEAGTYDLVVACRVLHATKNMDTTMINVRKLLKPNGKLLLVEGTRDTLETSIVFGTLPGWWLSEEPERAFSPQLSCPEWEKLLLRTNFSGLDACVQDCPEERDHIVSIIFSSAVADKPQPDYPETVIIHGKTHLSNSWAESLKSSLATITEKSVTLESFTDAEGSGKVCIFINELEQTILDNLNSAEFLALRRLLTSAKGVMWLSRGGAIECERPKDSLISGLVRTLRSENQGTKYVTLDLDPKEDPYTDTNAKFLLDIFNRSFNFASEEDKQDLEFAVRDGLVSIPRVFEDSTMNDAVGSEIRVPVAEDQPFYQPGRPLRVEVGTPGLLDTIRFVDDPEVGKPLPPDFVEVEPKAFGMNFRDVMTAMGQLDTNFLGCEASGIVTKIGSAVSKFKPGDRVCISMQGFYANFVRVPETALGLVPESMTFEVATSIPIIFSTVYYALYELAKLEKGEKVLIHSASGGVGQAAIMLAQNVGAEIFVTVGTDEKRDFIMDKYAIPADHIFWSRDTTFAREIMAITDNNGVDVILNSLAGEMLEETWNCISPCGRFIEIGARDMVLHSRLDMAPFGRNVSFYGVNLFYLLKYRPKIYSRVIANVMDLLGKKIVNPVTPLQIIPISDLERGLRLMQAGKHRGKLIIVPHPEDRVKALPAKRPVEFRDDASYLIVGGVGGIGRSIAYWMAKQGAKNLLLLSRSAATHPNAQAIQDDLKDLNCNATLLSCDITDQGKLASAIEEYSKTNPSVRGVIQAAMVLKDCIFEHMSHDQYVGALQPKVQGTWNLHSQFSTGLDFFVMLSSMVGVAGHNSQSNYGAGGAFLDAIARYRIAQGQSAVTLDLGVIEGVGFVSEHDDIAARMAKQGYLTIREEEVLAMVKSAITNPVREQNSSQVITGLGAGGQSDTAFGRDPRFASLAEMNGRQSSSTDLKSGGLNLQAQLSGATSTLEAVDFICKAIVAKLSEDFMIPEADISATEPIVSYGVDSLVAVELRNWLLSQAKAEISVFDVLQSKSLNALSETVAAKSKLIETGGGN